MRVSATKLESLRLSFCSYFRKIGTKPHFWLRLDESHAASHSSSPMLGMSSDSREAVRHSSAVSEWYSKKSCMCGP